MNTHTQFQTLNGNAGTSTPSNGTFTTINPARPYSLTSKQALGTVMKQMIQPAQDATKGTSRSRSAVRIKRPLIVIGAGGTGRWVVTTIKSLLLQTFGVIPENVTLLALDSGAEVIAARDPLGRTVQLDSGSEFISLGKVPIAGIKRNPTFQSELANRLGDNLYKIHRQSIVDGCSQNRIEGLATLYFHFDSVFHALTRAIQRVTGRNNSVEEGSDDTQKLNIVLIGSLAGGQGAGILLDLALIMRELLSMQGGWEDTAQMTGFMSLPSAFNDVKERDKRNMAPNTVAALRELEMLQRGERVEVQYPNRIHVRNIDAPFDHVYVVEGIDERGFVWQNQRDVCQMVARGIVLLTAGQVGMSEIAFALNQQSVLMNTSRGGNRTYLAALGLSELYYPGDLVLAVVQLRHVQAMLNAALQQSASNNREEILADAPAFTLTQLFTHLQNGVATHVKIPIPDDLRQPKQVEQVPAAVRDYVGRLKAKRVYELLFAKLAEQVDKVFAQVQAAYQHWLDQVGNLPALPQIQHCLRTSLRQLATLRDEIRQEQKKLAGDIDHKKREVTNADVAMVQAAESFYFGRKDRTLTAANHFVDEAEQMVQLEVRERQLTLSESIVQNLEEWLQKYLGLIEEKVLHLQSLLAQSQSEEQRLLRVPLNPNVVNLADAELIHDLYQRFAPAPNTSLQSAIAKAGGWWSLAQQSDEGLLQHLRESITPAFELLATLNVEDVLQQRWPDRTADSWVQLLTEKAAVAWNMDKAKLPPGAESLAAFLTVGVPNGDNSFFSKAGLTCTSTGDPQRIIALRTVYGGSIDALKSLARWEVDYQAALKAQVPLHLFDTLEPNKERALALLGLGLLFEFLRRKQTWFHYQPEDVLDKPIQIAHGLEKTIESLNANQKMLDELEKRINRKIAQIGKAQAAHLIQQWVDQNQERDDELFTTVLRAVRSFAEQLK